jgi:hypothetical protein
MTERATACFSTSCRSGGSLFQVISLIDVGAAP